MKAPRQFGKTSLLHQIRFFALGQRYKSVYLNFQDADERIFAFLNQFLRWFCVNITAQLDLHPMLDDYWDEEMGSKMSCKIYFEKYLLQQLDQPLVLLLDEVNRVFEHPHIALDFFSMLRSWHEQAKYVQTWQKLRLVVAYATDIYIPLKLNQSPFNVGLGTKLPQLTLAQVQELAARYALDWRNEEGMHNAMSLQAMVGGHPYLTNLAFYYLRQDEITIKNLLKSAPTQTGIYRHHLHSHLVMLKDEPMLATALRQVVMTNESVQLDAIAAYKLESLGLIQLEGDLARASCELYHLYLRQQLRDS